MRDEIEAAALFITKLVNKHLLETSTSLSSSTTNSTTNATNNATSSSTSNSAAHSSSEYSIHSASSSAASSASSTSSSSSTSSESPPGFDEQLACDAPSHHADLPDRFRQCLTQALYDRFHDHWFPDQPTKGQAYRCIRLNSWDRHDIPLQAACTQCGIEYKDLPFPMELTLWVDPDEVTCRFGENKGSHCLVAKFKDGELRGDDLNIDINNIDIDEIFRQATDEKMSQQAQPYKPGYENRQHNHQGMAGMHQGTNNVHLNGGYNYIQQNHHSHNQHHHHQQQHHHHQQAPPNHRSKMGKSAIFSPYHNSYPNGCDNNGNPIYYYFNQ